ncbi:hypothetical protein GEMRC1_012373 [Eukaryota sp. GEM-RC1]
MTIAQDVPLSEIKTKGNEFFTDKLFNEAIEMYSHVLDEEFDDMELRSICFSNRAAAHLQLENFDAAKQDALSCIELKPSVPLLQKAYYRLGQAYFGLQKFNPAVSSFKALTQLRPSCNKVREQYRQAKAAAATAQKEKLLAALSVEEQVQTDLPPIPSDYSGIRMPSSLTLENVMKEIDKLPSQFPHPRVVKDILDAGCSLLSKERNVVDLVLPRDSKAVIIGDLHGQLFDALYILTNFKPSSNQYLVFLGDYVDRGSYSVEIMIAVLLLKLACPNRVVLLRGNHETTNLTAIYGCKRKSLPNSRIQSTKILSEKAFCVHGGLPSWNISIQDINALDRFREPATEPQPRDLMAALLWSDPSDAFGATPSKRGSGESFGPDITARFLQSNGLQVILRGHEVRHEGYDLCHENQLATIFSAPNYVGNMGNLGAIGFYSSEGTLSFTQFKSVPTPPNALKPLHFCSPFRCLFRFIILIIVFVISRTS